MIVRKETTSSYSGKKDELHIFEFVLQTEKTNAKKEKSVIKSGNTGFYFHFIVYQTDYYGSPLKEQNKFQAFISAGSSLLAFFVERIYFCRDKSRIWTRGFWYRSHTKIMFYSLFVLWWLLLQQRAEQKNWCSKSITFILLTSIYKYYSVLFIINRVQRKRLYMFFILTSNKALL